MKPIIEVKNLSKKYRFGNQQPYYTLRDSLAGLFRNPLAAVQSQLDKDEFWALKDINFEVNQGEVVGIIGRNGAGKSTLLKILSQITPPTEGEIILRGRVGSLLEVGTGFSPELTGRENIYLNGAVLGMSQAEVKKKFDEIVAFSEVEKFLDTPLKHYSSGMYMRLAFSVAAHLEPEILIVDEVLAVGDAEFQKKCLGKMGEVAGQGRTVLFVSHNMNAVARLCKYSAVLENGSRTFYGETSKAINFYEKDNLNQKMTWVNKKENDNELELLGASLSDGSGSSSVFFTNFSDIFVILTVRIKRLNSNYVFHFNLEKDSQIVFSYPIFVKNNFEIGINKLKIKIPKNLLNTGTYSISFEGSNYCIENFCSHSSILTFPVSLDKNIDVPLVENHVGIIFPYLQVDINENIK